MALRAGASLSIVVLLLGGALALPGSLPSDRPGRAPGAPAPTSIQIAAVGDYQFSPATVEQVPTATRITITLTNNDPDQMPHTLNISSREGYVIPITTTPAELDQLFAAYPSFLSLVVNATGDSDTGSFLSPAEPGWYEFVCNVSGHFQNGMYGFIAFGEALPPNLSPPSRVNLGGAHISPLDGAVLGCVAIGILAVAVLGLRRRSANRRDRSPPAKGRSR